jgi:hypothetical protein
MLEYPAPTPSYLSLTQISNQTTNLSIADISQNRPT